MKKNRICCLLFIILALTYKSGTSTPLYAEAPDKVVLPIIMYHSLSQGASGAYSIAAEEFEKDLKYLYDNGFHTVGVSDLVGFVYNNAPLPEKPIVLTFDDGYYNNFVYVPALLKKYDMKAVVSIIGADTEKWSKNSYDDLKYGHVTWTQISDMLKSGHVEIANHTFNLHLIKNGRKGCSRKPGENVDNYCRILKEDIERLQTDLKDNIDYAPECFTYPFGFVSPESTKVLKDLGFKVAFTQPGGPNTIIAGQTDCLFNLKRLNRSTNMTLEKILSKIASG